MIDFVDRQPTQAGRRKIIFEDGDIKYATVEMADDPTVEGTPLNRKAMMAIQGFQFSNTVFDEASGTITEINELGERSVTTFNADESIDELFTNVDNVSIRQRTTFNSDGSVTTNLINLEMEV